MASLQDESRFGLQGEITPMFTASLYLVDALEELTTEELQLVKGCARTKDDARLVMELVSSNGIYMPNED